MNSLAIEALNFLSPKVCSYQLIRFGGTHDGSYILPDCLDTITDAISPGVATSKTFEDELSDNHDINYHMCDASVPIADIFPYLLDGKQTFLSKYLSPYRTNLNICLEDWLC